MFRFHPVPNHNPNLLGFHRMGRARIRRLSQYRPTVQGAIASATRRSGIGCARSYPSEILFVHLPVTIGLMESEQVLFPVVFFVFVGHSLFPKRGWHIIVNPCVRVFIFLVFILSHCPSCKFPGICFELPIVNSPFPTVPKRGFLGFSCK